MASAQDIIRRAQTLLIDEDGVRWSAAELVGYLNDGQRQIVTLKPTATATIATHTLVAGPRQTIPADGMSLIDVYANATGRRTAVRRTDRTTLEAVRPGWMGMAPSTEIVHFMPDPSDSEVFFVYPPALPTAQVELCYARYPVDVPTPAGPSSSSVTGATDLSDSYANRLLDYILYRAYNKDAEFGGNVALSTSYFNSFMTGLGMETQAEDRSVAPT